MGGGEARTVLVGNEQTEVFFWVHPPDYDQSGISFSLFKHEFGLSQSSVPTDGTGSTRVCCSTSTYIPKYLIKRVLQHRSRSHQPFIQEGHKLGSSEGPESHKHQQNTEEIQPILQENLQATQFYRGRTRME